MFVTASPGIGGAGCAHLGWVLLRNSGPWAPVRIGI